MPLQGGWIPIQPKKGTDVEGWIDIGPPKPVAPDFSNLVGGSSTTAPPNPLMDTFLDAQAGLEKDILSPFLHAIREPVDVAARYYAGVKDESATIPSLVQESLSDILQAPTPSLPTGRVTFPPSRGLSPWVSEPLAKGVGIAAGLGSDPITYALLGANKVSQLGKVAQRFIGPPTPEKAARLAKIVNTGKKAERVEQVATVVFTPQMALSAIENANMGLEKMREAGGKLTPGAVADIFVGSVVDTMFAKKGLEHLTRKPPVGSFPSIPSTPEIFKAEKSEALKKGIEALGPEIVGTISRPRIVPGSGYKGVGEWIDIDTTLLDTRSPRDRDIVSDVKAKVGSGILKPEDAEAYVKKQWSLRTSGSRWKRLKSAAGLRLPEDFPNAAVRKSEQDVVLSKAAHDIYQSMYPEAFPVGLPSGEVLKDMADLNSWLSEKGRTIGELVRLEEQIDRDYMRLMGRSSIEDLKPPSLRKSTETNKGPIVEIPNVGPLVVRNTVPKKVPHPQLLEKFALSEPVSHVAQTFDGTLSALQDVVGQILPETSREAVLTKLTSLAYGFDPILGFQASNMPRWLHAEGAPLRTDEALGITLSPWNLAKSFSHNLETYEAKTGNRLSPLEKARMLKDDLIDTAIHEMTHSIFRAEHVEGYREQSHRYYASSLKKLFEDQLAQTPFFQALESEGNLIKLYNSWKALIKQADMLEASTQTPALVVGKEGYTLDLKMKEVPKPEDLVYHSSDKELGLTPENLKEKLRPGGFHVMEGRPIPEKNVVTSQPNVYEFEKKFKKPVRVTDLGGGWNMVTSHLVSIGVLTPKDRSRITSSPGNVGRELSTVLREKGYDPVLVYKNLFETVGTGSKGELTGKEFKDLETMRSLFGEELSETHPTAVMEAIDTLPEVKPLVKESYNVLEPAESLGLVGAKESLTERLEPEDPRVLRARTLLEKQYGEKGGITMDLLLAPYRLAAAAVKAISYSPQIFTSKGFAAALEGGKKFNRDLSLLYMANLASKIPTAVNNMVMAGLGYGVLGSVSDAAIWAGGSAGMPLWLGGGHFIKGAESKVVGEEAGRRFLARFRNSRELATGTVDAMLELFGKKPRFSSKGPLKHMAEQVVPSELTSRAFHLFSDEVQLPGGGTRPLTRVEKYGRFMMAANILQEAAIRNYITRVEMQPLMDKYGLKTLGEVDLRMQSDPAFREETANQLTFALSEALKMTAAEGPTSHDPLNKMRTNLDTRSVTAILNQVPLPVKLALTDTPFTNFFVNNAIQMFWENGPLSLLMTKRVRNSIEFPQLMQNYQASQGVFNQANAAYSQAVQARTAAVAAAMKGQKGAVKAQHTPAVQQTSLAKGEAKKKMNEFKREVEAFRSEGLRSRSQIASHLAWGPIMMGLGYAAALYKIDQGDEDLTAYQVGMEPRGPEGEQKVKSIQGPLGQYGAYFALGDLAAKVHTGKYRSPEDPYHHNAYKVFEQILNSRFGGTTNINDLLGVFSEKTRKSAFDTLLSKLSYDAGRNLGSVGPYTNVAQMIHPNPLERGGSFPERGDLVRGLNLGAFKRGAMSNFPIISEGLPPKYNVASGELKRNVAPVGSLFGGKVTILAPLERFLQSHPTTAASDIYPRLTGSPQYDAAMMSHLAEKVKEDVLPIIQSPSIRDDIKALAVKSLMQRIRDGAHNVAKQEALEKGFLLPPGITESLMEQRDIEELKRANRDVFPRRPRPRPPWEKLSKSEKRALTEKAEEEWMEIHPPQKKEK